MTDSLQFYPVVQIAAGLLLLLMGRRLFWVFVGAIGFFVGAQLAPAVFPAANDFTLLAVAVAGGLLGALLSLVLQRLAVILAGGLALGLMAVRIAPLVGLHQDAGMMVVFIAAALLGAVIVNVIFNPALIVISSVTGAVMISEALPLDPSIAPLLIVPLTVVGVWLQARAAREPID
jgi:hypothetical protein